MMSGAPAGVERNVVSCMSKAYRVHLVDRDGQLFDTTLVGCRDDAHARERAINLLVIDGKLASVEVWDQDRRVARHGRESAADVSPPLPSQS